jgi:hypothetical protein
MPGVVGPLDPVVERGVARRRTRDLREPVEPVDAFGVHVAGEDRPNRRPGHRLEERVLVVDVVVVRAVREVLEQDGGRSVAQLVAEPAQPLRAEVAGLLQQLGRVEPDQPQPARVERVGRRAERLRVELAGVDVPAHLVVAGDVAHPRPQCLGDGRQVRVELAAGAVVGDVAAVHDEVRVRPVDGLEHARQQLQTDRLLRAGVGVGDHREPQAHAVAGHRGGSSRPGPRARPGHRRERTRDTQSGQAEEPPPIDDPARCVGHSAPSRLAVGWRSR